VNILAVDTTGEALSVALRAGEKLLALERRLKAPHDETLLPAVDRLLGRAGIALEDLDAIAAASGPGRFTGIRIGMAFAAVASSRMRIPALAVSLLEAIAFQVPEGPVCAVVEGYRDERFYQVFGRGRQGPRPQGPPAWVAAQDWPGARAGLEGRGLLVAERKTGAADLLEPAARHLSRGRLPRFEPLYLKPAGYEPRARGARL